MSARAIPAISISRCATAPGNPAFLAADGHSPSKLFLQFLAGLQEHTPALTLFYAPNINSYKRFVAGSFAPTAIACGMDNRTCAYRLVGHGQSLRVENRLPGGDVNPYLALAAMIAAGLDGIERDLPPAALFTGNAYEADLPHVPKTLYEATRSLCRERNDPGGVRRGCGGALRPYGARWSRTSSTPP